MPVAICDIITYWHMFGASNALHVHFVIGDFRFGAVKLFLMEKVHKETLKVKVIYISLKFKYLP